MIGQGLQFAEVGQACHRFWQSLKHVFMEEPVNVKVNE
jgi:hypothetical protein